MTNSPASSSESSAFSLLDRRIQRWIWSEGWTTLRDIQELAIPALVNADQDVIISAATAGGKTEAAFFPIISHLLQDDEIAGAVLYISPLKALINDQWDRLEQLCSSLEVPVIPWHGDIPSSRKHRFLKDPRGILLITPESLEALFVTRGSSMPSLTASLQYVVVDELHSFIGAERGQQLQSLLHRVEHCAGRTIPRVALSATLGDMNLAAVFLRPCAERRPQVLESKASGQELKILVKCYETRDDGEQSCAQEIAKDLYSALRGTNNLIFPNRRSLVELYADLLRRSCEKDGVPNEFWAHHGNLSRELREETEHALKSGSYAATAVCTSTLELGIDIGSVKSIAQIGPPPSVSSLRQRLGRSGRRAGEPAILRCYCTESPLDSESSLSDRLREGLVQTIAMIRLLLAGWFEPPDVYGLHASTFVQQVMSEIAERGGATAASLWSTLIRNGPFSRIDKDSFVVILREMGTKKLVMQDRTGLILHGELGEKLVNGYEFYSAFASEDEFALQYDGHTLGSLPVTRPLVVDQRIIFGGRRWRVTAADSEKKVISVVPDPGGVPPTFDSAGATIHDRVRQEMRQVLGGSDDISFLNEVGRNFLTEARASYHRAKLDSARLIEDGNGVVIVTWYGDKVNDALALALSGYGHSAWNEGLAVRVRKATVAGVRGALARIKDTDEDDVARLEFNLATLIREKWDWTLPYPVLLRSFSSTHLDTLGARRVARELCE
jgi:ATP-dependent Lhr-like helicase